MEEIWKPIEGYETLYAVSNLGRIKRYDSIIKAKNRWGSITYKYRNGNILKAWYCTNGYTAVSLSKKGVISKHLIHRLVAKAFLEQPDGCNDVNHIDHTRDNNQLSNLEWVTTSENIRHAHLHNRGIANQKLTTDEVKAIRASDKSRKELATLFNVSLNTIYDIISGRTWAYV